MSRSPFQGPIASWLPVALAGGPWRLSGTVVGALLNHRADWQALGARAEAPPYKGRARAPVLQVKPRNTLVGDGARVGVLAGVPALQVDATLAIVIARPACRVAAADALAFVAGYSLAADIHVPDDGAQAHYRPAVRLRARDGFCPIGPRIVPAAAIAAPDGLAIDVAVDDRRVQQASTGERVRDVATLIADVSAFMTLHAGDVLLLGAAPGGPRVAPGQAVSLSLPAIGTLHFELVAADLHDDRPGSGAADQRAVVAGRGGHGAGA